MIPYGDLDGTKKLGCHAGKYGNCIRGRLLCKPVVSGTAVFYMYLILLTERCKVPLKVLIN
jgi:hypothetical protein